MANVERLLVTQDFSNHEALNFVLQSVFEDPVSAVEAKIIYNNFNKVPKYYNGTEWVPMSGRPVQRRYADQTAMLGEQGAHLKNFVYYRSDEDIYYEYLGTTLGTMADYNAIGGAGTTYIHPAKAWVDKTALSGATVISNLTIDSLGHPTDWVTRNLTPADIGAATSSQINIATGQVAFATAANTIGGDSGLVWDNVNKRMGINQPLPNAKLEVNGNLSVGTANKSNGGWPLFISDSTNLGWKVADSSGAAKFELYVGNGGVNQMRLLGGVSIIGFNQNLVLGTINFNNLTLQSNNGFVGVNIGTALDNFHVNGVIRYGHPSIIESQGRLSFGTNLITLEGINGSVNTSIAILPRGSGKVGINTEFPTNTADINGTTRIRTRTNGGTTFAKFDAAGVFMERTLAETKIDLGIQPASVPVTESFTYSTSYSFSLSNADPTIIFVTLNGQVLREGSIYDYTVSGTTLAINSTNITLRTGDEIIIRYYTGVEKLTTVGRNIDGGAPDSVYLPIQNVNGGTP